MLAHKHIVIAEDDIDDIFMFRYAFDEICRDLQLHVAKNGVELMKVLKDIPTPCAIFLDVNMPLRNGKECLKEIRADHKYNEVQVVMLSTSDSTDDIDFCLQNGANQYYAKPESYQGLKNILIKVCKKELVEEAGNYLSV